jgi:hypothetical protein
VNACLEQSAVDELDDLLRPLEGALTNLGFIAAVDYCRTQSEQLASGKQPDAELVKVLARLVEDGWRMCDATVGPAKATEPLASAA